MGRGRHGLTKADYVAAALEFIDEHGMEPLTMRALGEKLGVDPTAVYRHYPNKEDLVLAVCDKVFGYVIAKVGESAPTPRERTEMLSLTIRAVFREHPHVLGAIVNSTGYIENGFYVSREIAKSLVALGVPKASVPIAYQMLEGYVMGACLQDFTSSPQNWAIRRQRYRGLDMPEFDAVSSEESSVESVADQAFLTGLTSLIDACLALRD